MPRDKDSGANNIFYGPKGKIYVNRGVLKSEPAEIIKQPIGAKDVHLYRSTNHHDDWLACVKSGKLPICDVEIGQGVRMDRW